METYSKIFVKSSGARSAKKSMRSALLFRKFCAPRSDKGPCAPERGARSAKPERKCPALLPVLDLIFCDNFLRCEIVSQGCHFPE